MSFGGDLAHTRANLSETMISVTNASELKNTWDIKAPGVTATPAVSNGVVYWGDWGGNLHATKVADGTDIWTQAIAGMETGYLNSPALSSKWVYFANRNGKLSAHDRNTGAEIWTAKIDAGIMTYIWSSPIVIEQDNVVVIGVAGQGTRDNGTPIAQSMLQTLHGRVEGYDATTGQLMWQFETSPDPMGAGVSVWSSAAVDTERKLAFIGTGNNYYRPVSEYSDSMLAIEYLTGNLKWHHQFTMNDAWTVGTAGGGGVDADVGATPNLFSIDGRAAVGVGDKSGSYYVLDRETGMRIWTRKLTNGSSQGGVMAPAAYANDVVYVVSNSGGTSTVFALDAKTGNMGGQPLWTFNLPSQTFGGPAFANGVLFVGDQQGNMRALNASNGMSLWMARAPAGRGGGFAILNGMLYTGYGYHFSESRREPLMGGLLGMSLTGEAPMEGPVGDFDCKENPALTADVTFANIYQGVLCASGCMLCHGDASTEAGLALMPQAKAYTALVGAAPSAMSECAGSMPLVQANNATGSLLYLKITNMSPCGSVMPPGDPAQSPVTQAMRDRVRDWIQAGAMNN